MVARDFSLDETIRMMNNRNNPKTMDYYFLRILNVISHGSQVYNNGEFTFAIRSNNRLMSEAFQQLNRNKEFERASNYTVPSVRRKETLFFILYLFEHAILPKGRTLRIVSRRMQAVNRVNVNAGKPIPPPSPGTLYYYPTTEPAYLTTSKYLYMYCRNNWERKGNLKLTEPEEEYDDNVGINNIEVQATA